MIPSILDRLIDEGAYAQKKSTNTLPTCELNGIRRDLQNLLNTRKLRITIPDAWRELNQSLIDYGVEDFMTGQLNPEKNGEGFCRSMELVIQRYEPRLKNAKVTLLKNKNLLDRCLRYRIEAIFEIESIRDQSIVYHAVVDPISHNYTTLVEQGG